jgi:hypothetical protein
MSSSSKHLTSRQLRAIEKIGNQMIPGIDDLPSFSATGCVSEVDRVLDYMPDSDLKDLKLLLSLLSIWPGFLLGILLRVLEWSDWVPAPVGGVLRMIRLGLRGLVMSLYYSHPRVLSALEYQVGVYLGDRTT